MRKVICAIAVILALTACSLGQVVRPEATPAAIATTTATATAQASRTPWVITATSETATPTVEAVSTDEVGAGPVKGWMTKGNKILDPEGNEFRIKGISWFGMETESLKPEGLSQRSAEDHAAQMKELGFNTIRLPFSGDCVAAAECLEAMDKITEIAQSLGMMVIPDYHRIEKTGQSPRWYTDGHPESEWIDNLRLIAKRYESSSNVIGIEIFNEPHSEGEISVCWDCRDAENDWAMAAEKGGNAVIEANPNLLVFVQGIDHVEGWTWWGGNLEGLKTAPVNLKTDNKVVYVVHDYPQSVFSQPWFNDPEYPDNLTSIWDQFWGQFANQYPIIVGEFGTKLESESDRLWLEALVDYIQEKQLGWVYWDWNPSSGDTGGILKADWMTVEESKIEALQPLLKQP